MFKESLFVLAATIGISVPASAQIEAVPHPFELTITKAAADQITAERFDRLDTDRDGNVTASELESAPGGGRGIGLADSNGDGSISRAEYASFRRLRFVMQDSNKDGKVTRAEREAFHQQHGSTPKPSPRRLGEANKSPE